MNVFEILTALSPIVLMVVATHILIRQYQLDKKRFRLEHFDQRYAIYKSVLKYLTDLVSNADTTIDKMFEFKKNTSDVSIFFDKEIKEHIDDIYSKAIELRHSVRMLNHERIEYSDEKRARLVEKESEILKWLGDQFTVCEELFVKYLKID